ncbi:probable pyruvate dehydrogenase E1 component subunit alpha, mitochondrial [Drosophila rhopaloa]|uniref:Pyruvate dehydrogenase E1 component subunit alpha n=1 Tax=Drosophila rhopaloa TaxID=1041015 RepID=A0A6P4EF75_DRORH|nr:probable pyruvate dehydrogenase E1 component subunit alpha, mitochondrial [Drosophila rhopaloa]
MMKSSPLRLLTRCSGVHLPLDAKIPSRIFGRHKCSCLTLENTFKCYDLETGPTMDVELSREDALAMYTKMLEVRRMETVAGNLYKQRQIRGFCHLYTGQEAVAVGMKQCLRQCDSVITAYRCHAWTYLMGVSMHEIMAELLGVRTGCSRGKGGSMHMYTENFYGGNGIVGAQVPVGTGVALAHSYRNDNAVCVVLYGDGAANQGQVFESFNMAKLWCLPCIFVCENNHYGMGTHEKRASAMTEFYMRGQYIPGLWVDGNQVLAVRSATQFALDYALNQGPIVLEMSTYRYVGHSMSDPGTSYRSRKEVQAVREQRDPIISFRSQIIALCLADEEELKILEDKTKKQVDKECNKASADKEVDLHELHTDIYAKNVDGKIRGVSGFNLEHIKLAEVCFGKPKKTPASEIKEEPVVEKDAKKGKAEEGKAKEGKAEEGKAKEGKAKEGKAKKDSKDPNAVKDPKAAKEPKAVKDAGDNKGKPPASKAAKQPKAAAPPAQKPPTKAPPSPPKK